MISTLKSLYRTNMMTPRRLYGLAAAVMHSGMNLMALLRYAARLYPDRTALFIEDEAITYGLLYRQAAAVAAVLARTYGVRPGCRVAIMCRNHAELIQSLFAVSGTGADLYLLSTEMSTGQFEALALQHCFDVLIADAEPSHAFSGVHIPASHSNLPCISAFCCAAPEAPAPLPQKGGKITVLTGGTTGAHKAVARKPDMAAFLSPFCALLDKAGLAGYQSVHIATPVYHGYGLAALLTSVALGCTVHLRRHFDAADACRLFTRHHVEVVALVPLMLRRMLQHDAGSLKGLRCIISGSAPLPPALVQATTEQLGQVLFNLYGTSEAGFSVLATPADLAAHSGTIGRGIHGVEVSIANDAGREAADGTIGHLHIKSKWTTAVAHNHWIATGDMAYRTADGLLFLCGRTDDMLVSGGENVFPSVLEDALGQHPQVSEVAVIGIPDDEFGQRMKAFVVALANSELSAAQLMQWLRPRVARYQMPAYIDIVTALPYTALGKPDKKQLQEWQQ